MTRSDEEKLIDIMMGEAVLALINAGGAINNASLIKQLQTMAKQESDPARCRACKRAIHEVIGNMPENRKRVTQKIRDTDNVVHIFTNEGPADGSRKH
ncbi:hypothetical protein N5923_22640 [Erwiniaceae bacterium BAC15a-03b]|uniref:Uncharacterized protein n=1 Tax=Winslowiella arboricola TaxID=2978220 RepID=A0A9J6PPR8_9GAMM|nr:hypothetical protein [Winslowiella arboricola]MCU5775306.1 hypothetical protein [Winslowiella arboricola]MCU5780297.1 hypothetical protein [Winslowiella arboricola]